MKTSILALGFVSVVAGFPCAAVAKTPVLNVLTYDSFNEEWGAGPSVEKAFEASCSCDLKFVSGGSAATMVARVQMEGKSSDIDVVLGLDTNMTAAATASGLFAPHGQTWKNDLPVSFSDPYFVPYDWGWLAFVYNKNKLSDVPKTFEELAASDIKIVIEDPRSSAPGLGLLLWIKTIYGDKAKEIWTGLADNIVTVTPSWAGAYGMFTEGEVDMVLSYTTSPAYHLIAENDDTKAAAVFDEGHYMQIEVAGKLAATDQPELADQFLAFIGSDAFQSVITKNWAYPAVTPSVGLPEGFDRFRPAKSLILSATDAVAVRDGALAEWQAVLAK
ncbi:MAG: thiamine ABC transporter substrate binding subunit [Rhodobacteraceae bacterium]|nr:thiamine ABC transporter substrate binding subunit [Paracoccaceae bacterium]